MPITTAPAAANLVTMVASYGGFHPSRIFDEHVVGMPRVHMLSFNATGTPASGPGSPPAATIASTASALARASIGQHEVERVDLGLACGDRGEMLLDDVDCLQRAAAHACGDLALHLAITGRGR